MSQTIIQWESSLLQGTESTVTVIDDLSRPVPGATVRATWRAGLPGERDVAVGITDSRGQVSWTPDQNGTVILAVRDVDEVAQVGPGWPGATEAILTAVILVAATISVVAGGVAMWRERRASRAAR